MRRRPSVLTALAVGSVLALTGCSGEAKGDSSPTAPTASTVATPSGAGTPGAVAGGTPAADGTDGEPAVLTTDSFVDRIAAAEKDKKTLRMSVSMSAAGQKMTMASVIDMRGSSPALDESVTIPGQAGFTVRSVDGLFYLNYGELSKNKWVEVDPDDKDDPLAGQFDGLLDNDPTQQIQAMKGAVLSLKKDGAPTKLDGVLTQKYQVGVDTAKMGAAMVKQLQASVAQLPKKLTYTYWIGVDDDLPRQAKASLLGMTMTMTFGHWGEPVSISAPKKADLLPGGLSGLTSLTS